MQSLDLLRDYGLFDARVPRYTSYPPANRFAMDLGRRHHHGWLADMPPDRPVSVYVHIPFCRRLCWFCACRTQGTTTLGPVDAYVAALTRELDEIARFLPSGLQMARLHLGGGTPTLLSVLQMGTLLAKIHAVFAPADGFEFSVEIDPTEASDALLSEVSAWGLTRASLGVQDFAPAVQEAIGRRQSLAETLRTIEILRHLGVGSLNIDLLYGLPNQTRTSFEGTLDQVIDLSPDRLALYGYAHVPHVSKRQVMIDAEALPPPEARFWLAETASKRLQGAGYRALGIDHYARPDDGLSQAAEARTMRRNFQGYTDDPCDTLLGFGASAISKFAGGYTQNAVATAAYHRRINDEGTAAHRGYVMSPNDRVLARLIEMLMCDFAISFADVEQAFPKHGAFVRALARRLRKTFPGAITCTPEALRINPSCRSLTRVIAAAVDPKEMSNFHHSVAI